MPTKGMIDRARLYNVLTKCDRLFTDLTNEQTQHQTGTYARGTMESVY